MKDESGSAFPKIYDARLGSIPIEINGLTKRELFAVILMTTNMGSSGVMPEDRAKSAIREADALLKELAK